MWLVLLFILSKQPAMSNTMWEILCQDLWKLGLQSIKTQFPPCHVIPVLQSCGHWDCSQLGRSVQCFPAEKSTRWYCPHMSPCCPWDLSPTVPPTNLIAVETNDCFKSLPGWLFYSVVFYTPTLDPHILFSQILIPDLGSNSDCSQGLLTLKWEIYFTFLAKAHSFLAKHLWVFHCSLTV